MSNTPQEKAAELLGLFETASVEKLVEYGSFFTYGQAVHINTGVQRSNSDKSFYEDYIGLPLRNSDLEPVSVACIAPEHSEKRTGTYIFFEPRGYPQGAYVLGTLTASNRVWVVESLEDGHKLHWAYPDDVVLIAMSLQNINFVLQAWKLKAPNRIYLPYCPYHEFADDMADYCEKQGCHAVLIEYGIGVIDTNAQVRDLINRAMDLVTTSPTPPTNSDASQPLGVQGDVDAGLKPLLDRYAQIYEPNKATTKVYDIQQKVEFTKTLFSDAVGRKLAKEWWAHDHKIIQRAEIRADIAKDVPQDDDDLENNMYQRYVLIHGTKDIWDEKERRRSPADSIKMSHANDFDLWLKSPNRRTVDMGKILFDPARKYCVDDSYINTFDGLPLKPLDLPTVAELEVEAKPILNLLYHLCEYDQIIYEWVLRWLAIPLQSLGTKMDTACIFHGKEQGAGKSLFFGRIMPRLYGKYAKTLGQGQMDSQYNDWVSDTLWVDFEEIFSGSDRYGNMGMVKQLITGNTIYISKKFMSGWQQDNYVNTVFLSNDAMPLSLEANDRRHLVCYPSKKIPKDVLTPVSAALDDPKEHVLRAFYGLLLRLPLKGQTPHTHPPMNHSKQRLINLSRPNWETFYEEWRHGHIAFAPYMTAETKDILRAYKRWCHESNERPTATLTKLMTNINLHENGGRKWVKEIRGGAAAARRQATVVMVGKSPEDKDQEIWLAEELAKFKASIVNHERRELEMAS